MAKSKTKRRTRKKPATNKHSLTATPKGFVKRIGRTGHYDVPNPSDPWTPFRLVRPGTPKKWYLGHDEDRARLLALHLQNAWKIRKTWGCWFPSDIAEFQVMKAQLYGTEVAPEVLAEAEEARTMNANSLRNVLDGTAEVHAKALASVREYQKTHTLPVQIAGTASGATRLYQAAKEFKQRILKSENRKAEWRNELCRRVEQMESIAGDMPLNQFGHDEITKTIEAWIAAAKKGKIAPDTSLDYIRAMRQFCDWLDASDRIHWEAPRRWEKLFSVSRAQLAAGGNGLGVTGSEVRTFTLDELTILYAAANNRCRLYLLLGLNCGWTQLDIATLTAEHLHLAAEPPYADRNRGKTGIYGRWYLWPETVEALRAETKDVRRKKGKPLLSTQRGNPLHWISDNGGKTDAIAIAWRRLRLAVGMTESGMSFKHIRKTGSQLVRDVAGKELSEAYLCHSDRTTGKHYNKFSDWSAMANALTLVRDRLMPMFNSAALAGV